MRYNLYIAHEEKRSSNKPAAMIILLVTDHLLHSAQYLYCVHYAKYTQAVVHPGLHTNHISGNNIFMTWCRILKCIQEKDI